MPLSESEADDEMRDLWDDVQPSPRSPITVTNDDCHKEQDPSLGLCTVRLERISLGTDGDARGSIEAKKKEAPMKRTVKRARRAKKECVPGRTYRWVENCLETKPSLDAQVFMSDCGSDILVGSRKDNLLDSSRCAYPCLSIAVPAAIKNRVIGKFLVRLYSQSSVKAEEEITLRNWLMGQNDDGAPPEVVDWARRRLCAQASSRDVRWPKFVGTGTERNAFPFKKDLFLSSFFSFFLFPKTGLSTLSNLSLD